jgi:hypothetical protein
MARCNSLRLAATIGAFLIAACLGESAMLVNDGGSSLTIEELKIAINM